MGETACHGDRTRWCWAGDTHLIDEFGMQAAGAMWTRPYQLRKLSEHKLPLHGDLANHNRVIATTTSCAHSTATGSARTTNFEGVAEGRESGTSDAFGSNAATLLGCKHKW